MSKRLSSDRDDLPEDGTRGKKRGKREEKCVIIVWWYPDAIYYTRFQLEMMNCFLTLCK